MGLFKHNLGNDILLSSEYIKVLLKDNEGIETIVSEISARKFGKVSSVFRDVLKKEKKGIPITNSLKALSKKKIHPHLKAFITSLISESGSYEALSDLSKTIVNNKKIKIEGLSRRIAVTTTWLAIIPLAPIFITIIDLLNQTFGEVSDVGVFTVGIIPEIVKPVLLLGGALLIFLIAAGLKLKQND